MANKTLNLSNNIRLNRTNLDIYNLGANSQPTSLECTDETDFLEKMRGKGFEVGSVYFGEAFSGKYFDANRYYYITIPPWLDYELGILLLPFWGKSKAYWCVTSSSGEEVKLGQNAWIESFDLTNLT